MDLLQLNCNFIITYNFLLFLLFKKCKIALLEISITLACPCHADCPQGCVGCHHWSCEDKCSDQDANPDITKVCSILLVYRASSTIL